MSRLTMIDPKQAEGRQKELLDAVQTKLGMTPNLVRVFANSPAVLQAYLSLGEALGAGSLNARIREQIALTVAETNQCGYCLSAHSAIGKMVGLNHDELQDARQATSADPKANAALRFARQVVEKRGWVSDDDIDTVRGAGWDDGEISEIVANVVANILTNYFNHIAETPIDFPTVQPLAVAVK